MHPDFGSDILKYFERLKATIDRISRAEVNHFLGLLLDALEEGRTVFTMGNGGSAATASHYAADFNKGLSYGKARRFRFMCLSDNVPTLTAYANDVAYDEVFVEQLRNFLQPGDLVIAISGSGNSRNILKAIEYANGRGCSHRRPDRLRRGRAQADCAARRPRPDSRHAGHRRPPHGARPPRLRRAGARSPGGCPWLSVTTPRTGPRPRARASSPGPRSSSCGPAPAARPRSTPSSISMAR